ncbi:glutathione hydrolase 1 proenzyme-like [Saccoglossus kowalevskii]|uniref:Gamma-glutamyltranspeptidase 1-like n=1 Tax=Saccoglossus kowalevskii TaxID=10224 RepID=A0ABM0MH76_SACKO|nr:PREDICTED: gamma-glutamyltranspeptidase 1-like [Saccoglossus kowalevskii]
MMVANNTVPVPHIIGRREGQIEIIDPLAIEEGRKRHGENRYKQRKTMSKGRIGLICCLVVVAATAITLAVLFGVKDSTCMFDSCLENNPSNSSTGFVFKNAAVAADSGTCSEVGRDILKEGGNAIDAAIATMLCNGVYNTQSHGIGGGHFMVIYIKDKNQVEVIDAREVASGDATQTMYSDNPDPMSSRTGGLAIGVPGEIDGFGLAHLRYGNLPWKDLFQPAIRMAEEGFIVGTALADAIAKSEDAILRQPNLVEIFVKPNGELMKAGDVMTRPKLAETLRRIAAGGSDTFYLSRLSYDIVADIQEAGGIITVEDLLSYRAKTKTPLRIQLGDFTAYTAPPPSGGAVVSLILNILKGYNFDQSDLETTETRIRTYHRIVEAFKFAFARRTQLADEDFVDLTDLISNMTSDKYAEDLRWQIDDSRTQDIGVYGGMFYSPEDAGTSHLSVIDEMGNAVAVTSSINLYFGSKVRGSRTGIIFNNEMDDFSSPSMINFFGIPPSEANFIEPGKRPLSSMSPMIILDSNDDAKMVVGAAGGTRIITTSSLVTMNALWFGDNLKIAVTKERLHHQLLPDEIKYETTFEQDVLDGLQDLGNTLTETMPVYSVVTSILRDSDLLHAYSDERKAGGYPAGY